MVQVCARRDVATRFGRLASRSPASLSGKILAAGGLLLLCASLASAQKGSRNIRESPLAAKVRALNNSLLTLHGEMQRGAGSEAAAIRGRAATVIVRRAAALSALVREDPRAALTFAFSPELLADLAAKFPQSASLLESHVTLSGAVQHWVTDYADHTSRESWLMNVGTAGLNLYFATARRPDLRSAVRVTITGVRFGDDIAVSEMTASPVGAGSASSKMTNFPGGGQSFALVLLAGILLVVWAKAAVRTARQSIPISLRQLAVFGIALAVLIASPPGALAQSCSTTGVQNVAVLLVNFSDVSMSVTQQQAGYDFFGGDGGVSLTGYWQEASYGQASATGSVFGPFTIGLSTSYTCSDIMQVFYDAVSAANATGVDLRSYPRIDIIFPGLNCGWAGVTMTGSAGAGCGTFTTAEGTLTASLSFNVAGYFSTRDKAVSLVCHENGHQLGLFHSGTITDEPTAVLGPVTNPGTIGEFNDFFSVMGAWTLGHYNAQDKAERLGWLAPATDYQTVTGDGTYTLQPLETSPAGLKALKVQRGTGNTGYYLWVEYRQPVGNYDSSIGFMNFYGALIHYETPNLSSFGSYPGHTQVMDFTPSDVGSWYDTVLGAGQTWTDPYSNVSISVASASPTGATVSVSYNGGVSSCLSSAPTVTLSPSDPSLYAGQGTSYAVSITDNDSGGCSSSTFDLASSEPSGWTTSLSSPSVALSPGQTTSVTLTKGAPSGTPAGTYAVNLTASDSTGSATGTANATVMAAPSLAASVSVPSASYSLRSTVPVTATVLSGSSPAAGASVTFTLTKADGTTATGTGTADSTGTAAWSYFISSKDPTGTYSVIASATYNSASATSSPATFTVTGSNGKGGGGAGGGGKKK